MDYFEYEEQEYQDRRPLTSTERFAKWIENNRERHKEYMPRYMRERRKHAKLSIEAVWCWEI